MPICREYMALYRDGIAEHLLVRVDKGKNGMRCWCNHGIPVYKKHAGPVLVKQHLTCSFCNDELRKWEKFWSQREESVQ